MMMPRFREMNPTHAAIAGILLVGAALLISFLYPKFPFVAGPTYKAEFSDGGGMAVGDEVEVAGTEVGKVTSMDLAGNKVLVTFTAKGVRLGADCTAAIKTGTLLGKRYLGLYPGIGTTIGSGSTIPLARTTAPYNVSDTVQNVSKQIAGFDKPKLEAALNSFSAAFATTPEVLPSALQNVRDLSNSINTRDESLRELLSHANGVSAVLADHTADLQALIANGDSLLGEIQSRRQVLDEMFRDFNYVSQQARDLVGENNSQLGPVLTDMNQILGVVQQNNHNLQLMIGRAGGFLSGLGEGLASGPWFTGNLGGLHSPGDIFNYTDVLRQAYGPQSPRLPQSPGLPAGLGTLPNPLAGPPSGAGATRPGYTSGGQR